MPADTDRGRSTVGAELMPTAAAVPIDPRHGHVAAYRLAERDARLGQADAGAARDPRQPRVERASAESEPARACADRLAVSGARLGGRPFSTDLAPSDVPNPRAAGAALWLAQPQGQQAANLMSPVGEHYPQQSTDWAAAAAAPAKALTRVQLALAVRRRRRRRVARDDGRSRRSSTERRRVPARRDACARRRETRRACTRVRHRCPLPT